MVWDFLVIRYRAMAAAHIEILAKVPNGDYCICKVRALDVAQKWEATAELQTLEN